MGLFNPSHLCVHVSVRGVSLVLQLPFKITESLRSQADPVILILKTTENNVNMAKVQTYQVGDMLCHLKLHRILKRYISV